MKDKIFSAVMFLAIAAFAAFSISVCVSDCKAGRGAFTASKDVYPVTAKMASSKGETAKADNFTAEATKAPETGQIQSEAESESETEEETNDDGRQEESLEDAPEGTEAGVSETEAHTEVETEDEGTDQGDQEIVYYGIWAGEYWHFTPEQIDAQWSGYKTSKPALPEGTTRAWQRYLYDKLVSIGAEHFYKIAVAQAVQESGMNPLNQQDNDSVPDKGLYSFRVYYWDPAYGDIYDYRANIDAYVARIAPYLIDRSEQGIYLALSQHYNPDGQIHMDYVQHVLGRLNELWEME